MDSMKSLVDHELELEKLVRNLSDKYNFNTLMRTFIARNKSSTIPYHNNYHAFCMVLNCYDASKFYELANSETRDLLIAALFHDFNHSGGEYLDTENINRALLGYTECCLIKNIIPSEVVKKLIIVTEYPYKKDPDTLLEKVIRDADLMQSTMPFGYEMCITRLGQEVSKSRSRVMSEIEILEGQIDFMNKVVFWTKWANTPYRVDKFNNARQVFMDKLEELTRK